MSFLENLVGRNLGRVSTIRPRPASMFEPVRPNVTSLRAPAEMPAGPAAVGEAESEIEAEVGTTPRGSSPKDAGRDPEPRRRRPRRISAPEDELDAAGSEIAQMNQDERRPASLRRTRPKSSANAEDLGTKRNRHEVSSPDTEVSDSDRHELRREPDAPLPGPRAGRERGGLLNVGPANADPPKEEHEFRTQLSEGNLSLPSGGSPLRAGGRPAFGQLVGPVLPPGNDILGDSARGMRSGERRDSAFSSRQAPLQQEPVIEVTIGRIEIRAETNGASNRKTERPASPVMGLDEYLRRRSNRGNA
jgi:hypothetical protein